MITRVLLAYAVFSATPLALAEDINGFWKHPDAPAWIEISLDEGKGTVVRNDKFPERAGRVVVKELQADDAEENLWHGQVYAERLSEYRKAEISLPEPDRMEFKIKVGFRSPIIEWIRVDEVPAVSAND
jgi:hypothetical protein